VKSGDTVIISGIIQDSFTKNVSKVPLLGDIPLLGFFFRYTSEQKKKTNLLIMLTPHIIQEPGALSKPLEHRQRQMLDPFGSTRENEVKRALRETLRVPPEPTGENSRDRPRIARTVRSGGTPPGDALLAKIPIGYARRHLLLPCRTPAGEVVLLSGGKPEAREAIDEMRFLAGSTRVVRAPENEVLARIDAAYERAHSPENEIVEGFRGVGPRPDGRHRGDAGTFSKLPTRPPVIRFVHAVLSARSVSAPAISTSSRTRRSWSSATGSTASSTR